MRPFGIKKRYWIPLVSILFIATCSRTEMMAFRMSDKKYMRYMEQRNLPVPEFKTYSYNRTSIHYVKTGTPGTPLLVFLHGSPGSSSAFKGYLGNPELQKQFRMISVDRPGFGYSGFGKVEPSIKEQSLALREMIATNSDTSPVILIGHSYGGPLIARMAMDYPEFIDGLIMVAPSIDPQLEPEEWWRGPLNYFSWLIPTAFIVSNKEIMALKEGLQKMMPLWKNVTCPVTVLQGMKDRLVPKENADFAKKMLINSERLRLNMLEGENHFILWTKKQIIIDAIMEQINYIRKE